MRSGTSTVSTGLASPPADPTTRERQVVALVGGGATNRELAEALMLSEGAAADQARRFLLKPGLRSRTRLADWLPGRGRPVDRPLAPAAGA